MALVDYVLLIYKNRTCMSSPMKRNRDIFYNHKLLVFKIYISWFWWIRHTHQAHNQRCQICWIQLSISGLRCWKGEAVLNLAYHFLSYHNAIECLTNWMEILCKATITIKLTSDGIRSRETSQMHLFHSLIITQICCRN